MIAGAAPPPWRADNGLVRLIRRLLRTVIGIGLIAVVFLMAIDLSDRPDKEVGAKISQTGQELLARAQELREKADETIRTEGEKAMEKVREWREEAAKLEGQAGEKASGERMKLGKRGKEWAETLQEKAEEAWERLERNIAWLRETMRGSTRPTREELGDSRPGHQAIREPRHIGGANGRVHEV